MKSSPLRAEGPRHVKTERGFVQCCNACEKNEKKNEKKRRAQYENGEDQEIADDEMEIEESEEKGEEEEEPKELKEEEEEQKELQGKNKRKKKPETETETEFEKYHCGGKKCDCFFRFATLVRSEEEAKKKIDEWKVHIENLKKKGKSEQKEEVDKPNSESEGNGKEGSGTEGSRSERSGTEGSRSERSGTEGSRSERSSTEGSQSESSTEESEAEDNENNCCTRGACQKKARADNDRDDIALVDEPPTIFPFEKSDFPSMMNPKKLYRSDTNEFFFCLNQIKN